MSSAPWTTAIVAPPRTFPITIDARGTGATSTPCRILAASSMSENVSHDRRQQDDEDDRSRIQVFDRSHAGRHSLGRERPAEPEPDQDPEEDRSHDRAERAHAVPVEPHALAQPERGGRQHESRHAYSAASDDGSQKR